MLAKGLGMADALSWHVDHKNHAIPGLSSMEISYYAGCALTTFNKGGIDLSPQVIAHRSSYTRGELLINPSAYKVFKNKGNIDDKVGAMSSSCTGRSNRASPYGPKSTSRHSDRLSLSACNGVV